MKTAVIFIFTLTGYLFELTKAGDSFERCFRDENMGLHCYIYYRHEVDQKQHTFLAHIKFSDGTYCAGTLVSKNLILTAAHCAKGKENDGFEVILGAHDLKNQDPDRIQIISGHKVIIHPNYKNVESENDVALAVLNWRATLDEWVSLVQLTRSNENLNGRKCITIGWSYDPYSSLLLGNIVRYFNAAITDNKECEDIDTHVTGNHLCTIGDNPRGTRDNYGDTGGPLLCNNIQVGVLSYHGAFALQKIDPIIYTRVSSYIDWIQNYISLYT